MALVLIDDSPPAYIVGVMFPEVGDVNWPFATYDDALAAYTMAVESGQFTHTLRKATKKRPALEVDVVTLWELVWHDEPDGRRWYDYRGCPPWHEGPRGDRDATANQT